MRDWIAHKLWRWIIDGQRRYVERTCGQHGHDFVNGVCRRCGAEPERERGFATFD